MSTIKGLRTDNAAVNFASVFTNAFPKLSGAISSVNKAAANGAKGFSLLKTAASGAWSVIAAHPLLSVAAAIAGVVAVVDLFTTSAEEANKAMEDSVSAYGKSKGEVESLNSELETTQARIDELRAQDSLSIVEQGELDRLEQVNQKLLIQKGIKEDIAEADARQAIKDTTKAYEKNFRDAISEDRIAEQYAATKATGAWGVLEANAFNEKDVSSILAYVRFAEEMRDAAADGSEEWLKWNDEIGRVRDTVFETGGIVDQLTEYQENLSLVPFDKLSPSGQAAYTEINDAIDFIYEKLDPAGWKDRNFNALLADEKFAETKDQLVDLAKEMNGLPDCGKDCFAL